VLTLARFRILYPQWADDTAYPDELVDHRMQMAEVQIGEDYWGDKADFAHGLLAAHLMEYLDASRGSGAQSVTAGPVTVTYPAAFGVPALEMTGYGKQYLALLNTLGPAAFTTAFTAGGYGWPT
jgi:hypothetical protein